MNYKTQMAAAKNGYTTKEMETVAQKEAINPEKLRELVACGQVAIPANVRHLSLSAEGIGTGLRAKINVNLGVSGDCMDYENEMEKVKLALRFGCESIMDLSNFGKTNIFRQELITMSPAMIGTVPMYDAVGYLEKELSEISAQDFLRVVEAHAREGVDFMTIHAGINRRALECFQRSKRLTNIVSRGGSLLYAWMEMTGNENPFFAHYDDLLDILREYDVTISIGDALRPGSIADSSDAAQIGELIEIGDLTKRAWARDVQVLVEGPGHMAMDEIAANIKLQKRLCHNAPFYVLGPIVTDIAPGYDHITSAIGGAVAAANGADFLCYVTPAEHLRLPDLEDVRDGIIAGKIAAHAADIAKGIPHAREADNRMSAARRRLDWDSMFSLAIDGDKAKSYFESAPPADIQSCSMCGKMCAMRTTNQIMEGKKVELGTKQAADMQRRIHLNNIVKQISVLVPEVRTRVPLVHQITNYVTVNDCANITLAVGASPIMADDMAEAADITAISSALVINIGTLNQRTIASMLASGKRANELGIPVIFDPVGAGASKLRNDTTMAILTQLKPAVIRGNLSEISFIAGLRASTRGVDASESDIANSAVDTAIKSARRYGCAVAVTGAVDVISDGDRTVAIHNGHKMLSRVTGTGCMATVLIGAFAGVTDDALVAATAGVAAMGVTGEIAYEAAGDKGTGSFRAALLDAVSLLDQKAMEMRLKIDEV